MSVSYDFNGKVALVTGANTGLAVSTAIQFAKSGARVVVSGQYADSQLTTVANECRNTGANVLEMAADPTREGDLQKLVDNTMKTFGRIDILVNCPVNHENVSINDILFISKYRETMQTNLEAMVFMTSICVEHLEITRGTIINMSSIRSTRPRKNESAYCMAKVAVSDDLAFAVLFLASKEASFITGTNMLVDGGYSAAGLP
ncbi:unnamed protein product [Oppiella nova]|uniref:Uncharacterized protein n=1 Tax=Oppiella nova TaxID=334625 RepID=A0A7R9MCL0_9ACAR|nr:unnamed protein product [Oppiella nova]CAG2174464.1 unnamed protein product [Oppiella nova]